MCPPGPPFDLTANSGHTGWCHVCPDDIVWDRDQRKWPVHLLYRVQTAGSVRGVAITVAGLWCKNGRILVANSVFA